LSTTGQKLYYNYDITVELKEADENYYTEKADIYAIVVGFETKEAWWIEHKKDISTVLLITGATTVIVGVFVASQERKAIRWR